MDTQWSHWIYVKACGFLCFTKNMGRNFNQKPLGITEKLETDALKTALGS